MIHTTILVFNYIGTVSILNLVYNSQYVYNEGKINMLAIFTRYIHIFDLTTWFMFILKVNKNNLMINGISI